MKRTTYTQIEKTLTGAYRRTQAQLDLVWQQGIKIDEMSVLFRDRDTLADFVRKYSGRNFNSVPEDKMVGTFPDGTEQTFRVMFEFLQAKGLEYRIEAMSVLGGHAPLHQARLEVARWSVFHASFKCESVEEYELWLRKLDQGGATLHANYENSYGRFSYWTDLTLGRMYLKPRVNLRDS